jgi:hypothetical protein
MRMSVVASTTGVGCGAGAKLCFSTALIANMPRAIKPIPVTAIMIPIRTRRFKATLQSMKY